MTTPSFDASELSSYTGQLEQRAQRFTEESNKLLVAEQGVEARAVETRNALKTEVEAFSQEITSVEDELGKLVQETRLLVNAFKRAATQKEFKRLQQRVDAWKGEVYIPREEFKRLIARKTR